MIPNNSNVIHKDNEYGLADDISISELNEESIESIDEQQTQGGKGEIENNYIETIKQDEYDPSRKQINNYAPKHYSEPKPYENTNNTHLPIDRIENDIGNKLNHKKNISLDIKEDISRKKAQLSRI